MRTNIKTMEVTLTDLKELLNCNSNEKQESLWKIGDVYLIRTVTMTQVGRLKAVSNMELLLEDAAWIADTGRFSEALSTGKFEEVEPFTDNVIIGRGAIVDAQPLKLDLPLKQK